jgi:hypothetical protein
MMRSLAMALADRHRKNAWLLVMLVGACAPASAALVSVQGDARDLASGRLLYREQHLIRQQQDVPIERLVVYRCPDGTAFARKHVDYRASRTAPDFELLDVRRGYREGLRRRAGSTLTWSSRPRSGGVTPKALRAGAGVLVADVGFDEYLRTHWDALLAGRPQTLSFVVPTYGRTVPFQVRSLGRGQLDGVSVERFRLKLGGLLGMVGPSMDVAYLAAGRRLLRFSGVTNLRDDRDKPLKARIDFPATSATADASQWLAALALPLSKCALGR